jgi:hypothetical protein
MMEMAEWAGMLVELAHLDKVVELVHPGTVGLSDPLGTVVRLVHLGMVVELEHLRTVAKSQWFGSISLA